MNFHTLGLARCLERREIIWAGDPSTAGLCCNWHSSREYDVKNAHWSTLGTAAEGQVHAGHASFPATHEENRRRPLRADQYSGASDKKPMAVRTFTRRPQCGTRLRVRDASTAGRRCSWHSSREFDAKNAHCGLVDTRHCSRGSGSRRPCEFSRHARGEPETTYAASCSVLLCRPGERWEEASCCAYLVQKATFWRA